MNTRQAELFADYFINKYSGYMYLGCCILYALTRIGNFIRDKI